MPELPFPLRRIRGHLRLTPLLLPIVFFLSTCSDNTLDVNGPADDNEPTVQTAAGRCGVERWSVKTGTDADAGKVNLTPQGNTIAGLGGLPKPAALPPNNCIPPAEFQVTTLTNVTLTEYKLENDSDYHLGV